MDQEKIRARAESLDALLTKYMGADESVAALRASLRPLLDTAIQQRIDSPMDGREIPGTFSLVESHLRKFRGLEEAYAEFRIALTGGESPALRLFRTRHGK